jgi:hypothetical protein
MNRAIAGKEIAAIFDTKVTYRKIGKNAINYSTQ